MFNTLGYPRAKTVPIAVSELCRWPFVLQLAWPYCSEQSAVRYTLSAHNCTTHYSEHSAVRYTLSAHNCTTHYSEQSAVRYTLSAHNCTTHYSSPLAALLHRVAVRWQHITPAGSNWFLCIAIAVRPYVKFRRFPSTTIFTFVSSAFLSSICLHHVQQSDFVEPTLRVTAQNLPRNSGTTYCVLNVTLCNSTVLKNSQYFYWV